MSLYRKRYPILGEVTVRYLFSGLCCNYLAESLAWSPSFTERRITIASLKSASQAAENA